MLEESKRSEDGGEKDANDPNEAPVDGPGGDEGPGGLGSTSQGSPGEAEGGDASGS